MYCMDSTLQRLRMFCTATAHLLLVLLVMCLCQLTVLNYLTAIVVSDLCFCSSL